MPSKRRQFNVRLAPEAEADLEWLLANLSGLSQADIVRLALRDLRRLYDPGGPSPLPAAARSRAAKAPRVKAARPGGGV